MVLDLRDARLTRPHELRERSLREMLPHPERSHDFGQPELRFDKRFLSLGEAKEFGRGTDLPAGPFESLSLRPVHDSSLFLKSASRLLQFLITSSGVSRVFLANTSRTAIASFPT